MNFSTALTALNVRLQDTDNFTFTSDQKTAALTDAWNDSYVVRPVWDNSLNYTFSTYQYAIPATITAVKDIYIKRNTTRFPEPIGRELWEVVGSNIQFLPQAQQTLSDNYNLWVKGAYKITTNDTLDTVNLQNYVLANAAYIALKMLGYTKVLRFLRNDTTLADIINFRNDMEKDMLKYRQKLQRDFQSA